MRMHHPIADRSAIVIGAGAAGLSCAASLAQSIQVTLLEASGRVGGRCHTVADLGGVHGPCELGATWMHGVEGNPAYALHAKAGLLHASTSFSFVRSGTMKEDELGLPLPHVDRGYRPT